MPEPFWIVRAKPVPPIIAMPPVLRLAAFRFKFTCVRTEPKIAPVDVHLLSGQNRSHPAATLAIRPIEPVIQAVIITIRAMLLIARMKTGEQNFLHIRLAVAIGILGVNDVRRATDNDALAPRINAVGKTKTVEEHGGFVVVPIALRIFEKTHNSTRF